MTTVKKTLCLIVLSAFCLTSNKCLAGIESQNPGPDDFLIFQGKKAEFTAEDGTKAVLYLSKNQLMVSFYPVGKNMYSFPANERFLTGKDSSGHDRGSLTDPTGFFYQDKNNKNLEFVITSNSVGGTVLDVFLWNEHFFVPTPFCPPHSLWGVKSVERKYSDVMGQDFFILNYSNGQKDAYYGKNNFCKRLVAPYSHGGWKGINC
jgi:hypothetical protein